MTLSGLKDRLGQVAGGRWLPLKWGAAVAVAVLVLHGLGVFRPVEPLFTDLHFALRGSRPPSGEVVVVGVSRQCTHPDRLGPWPWPRSVHARLIDRLREAGAKAICFDMYFSTPSADPDEDRAMAEAARRAGNVALAVYKADSLGRATGKQWPFIEAQDAQFVRNVDVLARATTQGHINVRDRDGIIRQAPVGLAVNRQRYYQLGLVGAARWLGVSPDEIWPEPGGLRVGERFVPIDRSGDLLVNYYMLPEQASLHFVSNILDGDVKPEAFRGKVVMVGQVTHGLQNADMVVTPEGPRFGVYVQAAIADNILSGRLLRRADPVLQALLVAALSLACAWRLFVRRVLGKVAWSVVFALAAALVTHVFFDRLNVLIDLTPCLAVVVVGNLYGALVLGILKADKEVERRDLEMQSVVEAVQISAEGEGGEIPERIVASIGRALGAQGCCLCLLGDGGLQLAASHGFGDGLDAAGAVAASEAANRWVARERRAFFFDGSSNGGEATILDRRIHSALIVPLASHDQLYGTLGLYNKHASPISRSPGFTEHGFRLISLLTQQASMTLERSGLADSLAEALCNLEAAQQQLIESERLSAVGRMANMIIHDIKNPMQGIRMFAEMAADAGLSADERREFSETMCREIDRLVGLCQEILDFARGTTSIAKEDVVLDDFLMETVLSLAAELEQNHVELAADLGRGGSFRLDAARMRRVVLNLCRNAVEAMGADGGTLRLATAATAGGGVRIEIADTGPGIPPEIADTLFEPFVTQGKDHGTGLGLAIVKKVVEDHGGTIDVASTPGRGTTFAIGLPEPGKGVGDERIELGDAGAAFESAHHAAAV